MPSKRWEIIVVFVVVATSVALRFAVATWNEDANDDHLAVVAILFAGDRLPDAGECWECFQPMLWYLSVAGVAQAAGVDSESELREVAQYVNVIASLLTLALLWKSLARIPVGSAAKLLAFSLFALNPKWIGISAQATNDSFVIFFSTLCLFCAQAFFSEGRFRDLVGMTLGATLAAISKGNGILLPLIVALAFMSWGVREARIAPGRGWKAILAPLLLFVAFQVATVPFLGSYDRKHQLHGTPFATNLPAQPLPALFEESEVRRPGITSVASGFFTFRFVDLLREPRIRTGRSDFPLHRTSLWSQLYGRAHSLHFDAWPRSWRSRLDATDWITRAIFVLGLVPTSLLLFALARSIVAGVREVLGRSAAPTRDGSGVLVIAVLAFLAFAALYSARYRDYSTMKAIFVLPALAGWFLLQLRGLQHFEERSAGRPILRNTVNAAIALLALLYVADVAILVFELASRS